MSSHRHRRIQRKSANALVRGIRDRDPRPDAVGYATAMRGRMRWIRDRALFCGRYHRLSGHRWNVVAICRVPPVSEDTDQALGAGDVDQVGL